MKEKKSNSISQNIKKYRQLYGMTQEELAGYLELDTQYYAQLERGERNFSIDKIIRLCSVFHVGVEDIIQTDSSTAEDTSAQLRSLTARLEKLSASQLAVVEKFITEIVPWIR